ncbi:Uncharacterized protein YnzC, UPF0291/DUF896 family [[Clostridium] aminophilum]|uniref:UPF0291 protein SAMN04487771_10135 n=1 Tax=[Clostridium] aminophilum TaxID=1526 RepID=A0A1I0DKA5_9FIRM|nr:DUF896 domain-containing protein [[Clostridium] aminophilum]SET32911.1 Uncharacterized protein YnzC, UPF0291/DUF896 family [[Clostridium] aminophilum]
MTEAQIARINELYHKSKSEGLNAQEAEEQAALRKQYIADIRRSLRGNLDSMSIQHPDGTITPLRRKSGK